MKILLNEKEIEVAAGVEIIQIAAEHKPDADIFIRNGFPVNSSEILQENDTLVLIKRGEIPSLEDLDSLMSARHSPGIHSKLKKACVGIAGCGGLGSTVAVALARVGIGHLIIADYDVVEPSNLNRQQYFVDQIGMLKVEALKINLDRINPNIKITTFASILDSANIPLIFKSVDVLVEAFDKADQKAMLVETAAVSFPYKPIVLGVGMAGYGASELLKTRPMGNWYVCGDEMTQAAPGHGLMAPRVGIVAHLQANLVMEILLGKDKEIERINEGEK
ncbi:MAG: sulfur carrier protein ThiS adenylyltransferase ThiF [Candidatus Riflebacteria bacterium]|nr:sulfur carrier protein ThiS adenylyltransferase ThiF [Candidatus Riflebacteria bacterium]